MNKRSLYALVLGCSRLGAFIANRLSEEGHSVVVIDEDEASFLLLDRNFSGFKIEGNPVETAVLHQAKIHKADIVIATTRDDNINIMCAQIARNIFNVPRVISRIFDPSLNDFDLLKDIETICPTTLTGDLMIKTILNEDKDTR